MSDKLYTDYWLITTDNRLQHWKASTTMVKHSYEVFCTSAQLKCINYKDKLCKIYKWKCSCQLA